MFFKEIHFFNTCNKGDIHSSRGIVKNIIKTYPTLSIFYHHRHGSKLLQDITLNYSKELVDFKEILTVIDEKLYINTWLGQKRSDGIQFCSTWGCNCISNKELLNYILELLDKKIFDFNEFDVLPTIDYSKFNTSNIDNYIKQNNKNVLICNGPVLSGQCPNFSFMPLIIELAEKYKNINFILTEKQNTNISNIHFTETIINEQECDLNEVSYLSKNCSIVIGRASGPWTFAQTFDTLIDENKTFICFNNKREDAFFTEKTVCRKIWSNNYSSENVFNILNYEISKLC